MVGTCKSIKVPGSDRHKFTREKEERERENEKKGKKAKRARAISIQLCTYEPAFSNLPTRPDFAIADAKE